MQSGKASGKDWVLEFVDKDRQYIEPVMNWVGTLGTNREIKMHFASKESAIDFANKKGWLYTVHEPHQRKFVPKSYMDNFVRRD